MKAMKAPTKTMIAILSGTAALALAVGFGGVNVQGVDSTAATHTPTAASSSQAPAAPVHDATLTGCVAGLDC